MDKEKQICEMAKDICLALNCGLRKEGKPCYKYCKAYIYAFRAQNKGYRKASEVARETIAEAIEVLKEKCLLTVRSDGVYCFEKEDVLFWLRTIPLKIEKQYTEEVEG